MARRRSVVERLLLGDGLEDPAVPRLHELDQLLHVADHLVHRHRADPDLAVVVLLCGRVDLDDLLLHRHGLVLPLLQHLDQTGAAGQRLLGGLVEVGAELREGRQLAVLGQLELEHAGHLLHGLDLGGAADAGHRDADVDGRPHALEEEVGLEEDLPVGDGDDVGRDVGRHVAGLGLDDGQRGERAAALLVGELGGALQEAAVQVEHVARVGLAPRRAAEQERELPVGHGLLGEVVVDDERMPAAVAEVLGHGHAGVGRPGTAWGPGRRRWPRPRWCTPWRRTASACRPPGPPSTASGRWPRRSSEGSAPCC